MDLPDSSNLETAELLSVERINIYMINEEGLISVQTIDVDLQNSTSLCDTTESTNLNAEELLLRERINKYTKNVEGLTPLHRVIKKRLEISGLLQVKENEDYVCDLSNKVRKELDELKDAEIKNLSKMHLDSDRKRDQDRRKKFNEEKQDSLNRLRNKIEENEEFLNTLLKHKKLNENFSGDSKLLNFYAVCTLKNSSLAQKFSDNIGDVNQTIDKSNSWYPGYSALHFAAHCNAEIVRILVMKGGNLLAQDVKGVTPLDICSGMFSVEEVQSILSLTPAWNDILFSDGKTRLTTYLSALREPDSHKAFLKSMDKDIEQTLPKTTPFWPGWTILHIALTLLKEPQRDMISDILTQGADVTIQDNHGSTPVHLAFRQKKFRVLELLLKCHKKGVNPLDKDNLSHLHIAANVNDQSLTTKILQNERNTFDVAYEGDQPFPTVKAGWTPLHTAAHTNHSVIAKWLLQKGANPFHRDARGFTVVHRLLGNAYARKVAVSIFSLDHLKECVVEDVGLTHLHVAAWWNNSVAIDRLIDSGSDVETTIGKLEDEQLKKFEGCRAIHLAMMDRTRANAFSALLKRGADIFARRFDEPSPLVQVLTGKYANNQWNNYLKPVVELIWSSEKWQNIVKEKLGMTLLHVACYALDEDKIGKLMAKEVDVNAKMRDDSDVWPGFAPLHVLIGATLCLQHEKSSLEVANNLCNLLIIKGADVTLGDAEGNTPVLMALKARIVENGNMCAISLMKHQTDFSINPRNRYGMSHFHVACLLNEVELAKKFLKYGTIDVNQAVDTKDKSRFAGQTPLLLALSPRAKKYFDPASQLQVVDLLLDRGADVHAVDAFGYTPLHKALACSTRDALLSKILIDSKDINRRANDGKTPIEILLSENPSRNEVSYLVKRGSQINSYNPVSEKGYMAIVLNSSKCKNFSEINYILQIMMNLPDIAKVTETGRTAIHNVVANSNESSVTSEFEYCNIIEKLITLGCDIFQQDCQGRTALHLAVAFQNKKALRALLRCGADVNIVDLSDKSPFSYASGFRIDKRGWASTDSNTGVCQILTVHLMKLQLIGLQVSKSNAKLLNEVLRKRKDIDVDSAGELVLREQLKSASEMKLCNRGFTLRDFLYSTGPVNLYSSLKPTDRNAVDSFFKSDYKRKFFKLEEFVKLQYRNATQRLSLIAPAEEAIRKLLEFHLPDLCVEVVLIYLTNTDLRHMIAAVTICNNVKMIVD